MDSAQRLSASKINSGKAVFLHTATHKCSTPFGIKDQLSAGWVASVQVCHVLNAFRHQRSTQSPLGAAAKYGPECSTPFGIKDQLRIQLSVSLSPPLCAQRLSASKINSGRTVIACGVKFLMCSTPFGIKDQLRTILSAWSHLRSGAQRLSASKINSALPRRFVFRSLLCAQRLSASKINSARLPSSGISNPCVLNAFRHQRSTQSVSIFTMPASHCAQRLSASKINSDR